MTAKSNKRNAGTHLFAPVIGRTTLALAVSLIVSPSLAQAGPDYERRNEMVTAVAIAPDGGWGVATDPLIDHAIADAISSCKTKYRGEVGCGYQITTVHRGWSLVLRCGKENIIVAARTLAAAEQEAIDREYDLRQKYVPDMPGCVRVLSVDPAGIVVAPDVRHLLRVVEDRRRSSQP